MFFLLYRHAGDAVFDDFLKICEDYPKLFWRPDKRFWAFCEDFRTFCEDYWRLPKIAEDNRTRFEDVSIIHQQI